MKALIDKSEDYSDAQKCFIAQAALEVLQKAISDGYLREMNFNESVI